jgi:class 3 adenylate cyclase/predicted ATPase
MWSVAMDLGEWLKGLGLGQYEATFREHEIEADVLPDLTEADLEKIGLPLGARKRLMKGIADLASKEAQASARAPAPPAETSARARLQQMDSAERRPITVMFCDLVGSTSLAAKLDAEDWRNLVNAYLDEASDAVAGLGGHVLKKLGDGLMALFGFPYAQENDAERAVRAALAIQRALADLNARNAKTGAPALAARIGLDMGPVVVDTAGEVFGDAPNVAARVQAAAEPGTVLVTAAVQRQTAGLFVAEDKGARELKGVPQPVTLYRIVRASGGGRRGGARTMTPLVGREDELVLIMRRWARALQREGQFVQIVGEPGIGKSRLLEEFRGKLAETPHTWVEWASSQLLQNTPLHPVAEWGRQRFGAAEVAAERRLADLEGTLRLIGLDAAEYAPLLAPLVDIPLPEDRAAKFPPEELRRRQLAALVAWLLAGARSQPVALAFEDLHWADPTSLDLMQALAERGAQAPLLILATARPEFRPPWSLRSHHSVISLSPLDRADVAQMVGELAARHALSQEVVEGVSERTGGVPLFVEEVTRLLLERGEAGGLQAIPPTLQQSLAARLDRLGEAREVAQIGAVLGRDFTYALLRAVGGLDDLVLQSALDRLAGADLLIAEGAGHEANYRFKHALIQDAAYESLLKSRRQALHRRAAEILVEQLERAAAEPEVIAHHFTEAGLEDPAIEWWGKAGDQALRRSAFQEAIAHLGKAIAMADKVGYATPRAAPTASASQRLKLQTSLGQAMMYSRGFGSDESKTVFARARMLAAGAGDASERFDAYYGLYVSSLMRGELSLARETAESFLRDAETAGRTTEVAAARRNVGMARLAQGDFIGAEANLAEALRIYDPERDRDAKFRFGVDTGAGATSLLPRAIWPLGDVGRARSLGDGALARADETAHAPTRAFVYFNMSLYQMLRGDPEAARRMATIFVDLGREHGMALYLAWGEVLSHWARARLGVHESGMKGLREALAAYLGQGNKLWAPLFQGRLAELEAEEDRTNGASRRIDDALALANDTGEHWTDALLHRIRGTILLKRDPVNPAPAEEAFLAATAIAQAQKARSFELQAALALAKLYQSTARPADAHDVLAPALEGFSPTPEMPEIAEAQALLAALADLDEVKAGEAQRERRLHLQTAYGHALMWSEGLAANETKAAFARIGEFAGSVRNAPARLVAYYAQCLRGMVRGEYAQAREIAEIFLREAEAHGRATEAAAARRMLGLILLNQGELKGARSALERALGETISQREGEAQFLFDWDTDGEASAAAYLALAEWHLGELQRSRQLILRAISRADKLGHVATIANVLFFKTALESRRRDVSATQQAAEGLLRLTEGHGIKSFADMVQVYVNWTRGRLVDPEAGAAAMRTALAAHLASGNKGAALSHHVLLAELEATTRHHDSALTVIGEGLAIAAETGGHWFDPYLHCLRGDILLARNPADLADAEQAYHTGIAIALQQGARSYGLLASLALAKLYQSTGRPVDAHAVLAPALGGFAPTLEMLEIAEAQALLAELAESEEVKSADKQRRRMSQLQTALGNALIAARGYGAAETTEAFARAREFGANEVNARERFAADYGLWVGSFLRGELSSQRAHAAEFLGDVAHGPHSPEAGVAHRAAGLTHWFAGEYVEARDHLERALALFQPGRDDDLAYRFGHDSGVGAMLYLALVLWPLGDVGRAVSLVRSAEARSASLTHINTRAYGILHSAMFGLMRGDHPQAAFSADELARLAGEHDLPLWRAWGVFLQGVAKIQSGADGRELGDMRRGAELRREQNVQGFNGLINIALAEAEARAGDLDRAIAALEEALATCERIGHRTFDAELHRVRGIMLLRRDVAAPAPAEAAFRTAIVIAQAQKARSFELRAALALAKLYQSTGRPAEAHAVLAPALEGFSPTPEMPEIAEAQALVERLA